MGIFSDAILGTDSSTYADMVNDRTYFANEEGWTLSKVDSAPDIVWDFSKVPSTPDVAAPATGQGLPSAFDKKAQVGLQKPRNKASNSKGKGKGQGRTKTGQNQSNTGLKHNREGMVKADAEALLIRTFNGLGISHNFESELLDGRTELGGIRAAFIVGDQAIRLFDQNDSRREIEKAQLKSMGFRIVNVSPARLSSRFTLKDVVSDLGDDF